MKAGASRSASSIRSGEDAAGRTIPHEFVVFGELADAVDSVEDGLRAER